MTPAAAAALMRTLQPVSLEEVERRASLQRRSDTKYIVSSEILATLVERLRTTHDVLEVGGRVSSSYRTVYFDTAELATYRAHVQGRRKRYKVRARHYIEDDLCLFEVKLKDGRGGTVKQRVGHEVARIAEPLQAFVADCVLGAYGAAAEDRLLPTLVSDYRRMTLVARSGAERVTCDFDLGFEAPGGQTGWLREGFVIVECKSVRANGVVEGLLRSLGTRPVRCSKYCLGVGLTREVPLNSDLRRLARTHFGRAPAPAC
jgi:hypothetical protein